jgi:hypothetical protein
MMTAASAPSIGCDPKLCALVGQPHLHCACGLPMTPGEATCALCGMELLDPDPAERRSRDTADDPLAWDGRSYPSRRRHRVGCGAVEAYEHLILMVLRAEGPGDLRLGTAHDRRPGRTARAEGVPSRAALDLARELADTAGEEVLNRPAQRRRRNRAGARSLPDAEAV